MLQEEKKMSKSQNRTYSNLKRDESLGFLKGDAFSSSMTSVLLMDAKAVQDFSSMLEDVHRLLKSTAGKFCSEEEFDTPYMNKTEACQYLKISYNTLDSWIKKHDFPITQVGGVCRIDKREIDLWMGTRSQRVGM